MWTMERPSQRYSGTLRGKAFVMTLGVIFQIRSQMGSIVSSQHLLRVFFLHKVSQ